MTPESPYRMSKELEAISAASLPPSLMTSLTTSWASLLVMTWQSTLFVTILMTLLYPHLQRKYLRYLQDKRQAKLAAVSAPNIGKQLFMREKFDRLPDLFPHINQ